VPRFIVSEEGTIYQLDLDVEKKETSDSLYCIRIRKPDI
jgi:hypothetical protein